MHTTENSEILDFWNKIYTHICKSPEVSLYSSALIYMLLILSVRAIGADRGHLASSASVLWGTKDLSLMFYNRYKCDDHKLHNIIHELQR